LRRWRDGARHVRFMLAEAIKPRTRNTAISERGIVSGGREELAASGRDERAADGRDELAASGPGDSPSTNGRLGDMPGVTASAVVPGPSCSNAGAGSDGSQRERSAGTAEP
jgi:hypothetical protein